jgi:cytochrome c-type biogenesis protein CcmH/NrfG
MQNADANEKQQRFAEAAKAYREALRLVPGDAKATEGLKRADFGQHLAEGKKLLAARKFADAAREFDEALKISPDNNEAKTLLKRAKEGK